MRPHVSMLLAVPLVCSACEAREPRVDPPIAPDSGGEDSDADTDTDADADPPCPLPAFARIQPGVFMMGTPADQPGHMLGEDLHEVELTRAFDIAIHETTQAEYVACVGSNPSDLPCDTCPVENLSWDAAVAYANAVSESHGLTPCYVCDGASCTSVGDPYDCAGYRLPTEAECVKRQVHGTVAAPPSRDHPPAAPVHVLTSIW
ncbi:MAG: SUMF1/EgtB/PvdO family nonheme iron enzyme [Pseudomonadota bacterium]